MKNKIVWHYTYGHRIGEILSSGVLLPPCRCPDYHLSDAAAIAHTQEGRADGKLLLFSERQDWEPASYRGVQKDGVIVDLHRLEDYADMGAYRIGVSTAFLKPYMRLCSMVRMPKKMDVALRATAAGHGSNPFQWWGSVLPVPASKWSAVQQYDFESKKWIAAPR